MPLVYVREDDQYGRCWSRLWIPDICRVLFWLAADDDTGTLQVLTNTGFKLTTVVSLDPGLNWQIMITSAEMINH